MNSKILTTTSFKSAYVNKGLQDKFKMDK